MLKKRDVVQSQQLNFPQFFHEALDFSMEVKLDILNIFLIFHATVLYTVFLETIIVA